MFAYVSDMHMSLQLEHPRVNLQCELEQITAMESYEEGKGK